MTRREKGLTGSLWRLPVALVVAALFGTVAAGSANALTPPPAPSALVYSFGDQVIRMAADGSDRRKLTRIGPFPDGDRQGRTGDSNAQFSPNGAHLLLTRYTPAKYYGVERRLLVANADGTQAKRILPGGRNVSFYEPAWMPDGNSVAVARSINRRRGTERSVVIASLDGKSVKTVFRLPLHRTGGNMELDEKTYRLPVDIGVSPDGRRLLITLSNGYMYDRKWLVLVDLKTGKRRVVGKNTRHGSFSPDGTQFVYVSSTGNKGDTCTETDETSCVVQGDLYIQNVDGTGKKRITRSRAAEENPDWSPDGLRIAFDANYNLPEFGSAAEIYTIAPDGSCLSWLTNGSPAGVEPDWFPNAGRSDLQCGIEPRHPIISAEFIPPDRLGAGISVWAGPVQGNRLVSWTSLTGPFRFSLYEDCAVFNAKTCVPEPTYEVGGLSNCFAGLYFGLVVGQVKASAFGKRRGVTFYRGLRPGKNGKFRQITVLTGDTMLSISGKRNSTYAELIAQIDGLRRANEEEPSGRLPRIYLPLRVLKTTQATSRVVKRVGIRKAAERFDAKPKQVRAIFSFSKRMKMLGPIKTKTCTKEEADPFAGF